MAAHDEDGHKDHVDQLVRHYNSLSPSERDEVYQHLYHERHHGVRAWVEDAMEVIGIVDVGTRSASLTKWFITRFKR